MSPDGPVRSRRRGFSLIEVLVAISIIAILGGMILAAVSATRRNAKRKSTEAILAVLRGGLDLAKAQSGTMPSPAEHPLAGSRPPRSAFVRGGSAAGLAIGDAVDAAAEALMGLAPAQVPPSQAADLPRLLLPGDRFADHDLPLLYGLRRDQCGILGAPQAAVTAYRSLPAPMAPATTTPGPYIAATYPDNRYLVAPTGTGVDQKRALDYLLGVGAAAGELAKLKALRSPEGGGGGPIKAGRVQSPLGDGNGTASWAPGLVRDGDQVGGPDAGKPSWKTYNILGLAVYDAWGREILYTVGATGAVTLVSAGADGAMRIDPGDDRTISTAAAAEADGPAADDRDGMRDNVALGVGE
ncbi:MAG: type II secretion system protein [Minicystis sp.]